MMFEKYDPSFRGVYRKFFANLEVLLGVLVNFDWSLTSPFSFYLPDTEQGTRSSGARNTRVSGIFFTYRYWMVYNRFFTA